ncbi:TonB-dependent receptor [Parapedobacter koreensis]|uniref:Iron complex outermembrane recepter protein n=1 Tax=Parapedobacter koreensis TaxID=332977 RepID=A0A1H7GQ61_9SPHI|nr:TonB-dependent receptor [Parapedobacter koreensis]SEK40296.1 iron complex outermembrane recepter protein [Parapedobacter koreensis]
MDRFIVQSLIILLWVNIASGQQTLVGTVKNASGAPVPHATLVVKGTNAYTVAADDGQFNLAIQEAPPFSLQINSVGYKSREIRINEWPTEPLRITLMADNLLSEIVVTSRRRRELLQEVPIPVSVISGTLADDAGAFNVNRLKELVPSVQLYSSNPRNTGLSIRGLGTTFGLTNDGIDPGVGFYVDGVYYARTAATTLDFIDVEQIEVLRGPQGTLFGKNTVAGAFNVTTRRPTFTPEAHVELSYGNYGFIQAKASVSGPLGKTLAARVSFSGTQRDGILDNVATQKPVNDLNNLGFRGQLLYAPSENLHILFAGDISRQRPDGYAQVFAGVAPTLRAPYQQFEQIIADLGYELPSRNPFDRVIDHDTPWRSGQDLGGVSANVDVKVGPGTLTSTTAWRFWNWDPSNDRDFTGLQGLALSQAPSRHDQWSQEVRWAGEFSDRLSAVVGLYAFGQTLDADPAHTEEAGRDQWRFSQNTESPLWQTPGLLDGYGIKSYPSLKTFSGAIFAQVDYAITPRLRILPGIRVNYDDKSVNFRRETYGGLQTDDPDLLAIKRAVYSDQAFEADIDDTNVSGQLTVAFKAADHINAFATFANGFKPVGLNLGGLPNANGQPMLELAVIKPESVNHYEIGVKAQPTANTSLNIVVYNTDVRDYQAQVQTADLAVNRGYLANAEKVRVRGVEFDGSVRFNNYISIYGALAYTDGKYVSFTNAPPPLEETGGPTFKDISGGELPGISKWAASLGGEAATATSAFLGQDGQFFLGVDGFYRSSFSSNPSPSRYLVVDAYTLLNARIGFRATEGVTLFLWARNLFDTNYFEQLLPGAGNAGHYAGVLGDPRTYGVTLRYAF